MKHTLLFLFLFLSFTGQGQNAYYDSKYIIDWLSNPPSEGKEESDRQLKVYNKLKAYYDPLNGTEMEHYYMVDSIYAEFFRRNASDVTLDKYASLFIAMKSNKSAKALAKLSPQDALIFSKIETTIRRWENHKRATEAYNNAINDLEGIKNDQSPVRFFSLKLVDTSLNINGIKIPVYVPKKKDTLNIIRFWGRTTFSRDSLQFADTNMASRPRIIKDLIDSLSKSIAYMEEKKPEFDASAKAYFIELSSDVKMTIISSVLKSNSPSKVVLRNMPTLDRKEGQLQSQIRIEAQQLQPTVQLSNFKMPSQGEIIDALAIYVAKRFKQEAIMYMIDQLKENMLADTLFTIMFPQTRKLLFSQNAFSIPRFGTEWKYAISKDYTLMPDHILSDDYIGKRFDSLSFNSMHDAWLLAKMVEKKYSYVEIVRNYATNEADLMKTPMMKTFTHWSYILNEELFTTANPEIFGQEPVANTKENNASGDYWVTPANFNREMQVEQLSLLLVMLKQRHGAKVEEQLGIDLSEPIGKQAKKLLGVKKWMSRNLLILNQFQKNQDKLFTTEVKDDEKALFNGVSYWTFMNDIVSAFIDTNVVHNIKDYQPIQLQYVSDVNEIYGSFQNKNYPAAVSQLMSVIEHLCSENSNYMLSQDLKVNYKVASLLVKQSNHKRINDLSVYSSYFSAATNTADLKEIKKRFSGKVDGLQMAMEDEPTKYDRAAFKRIKEQLDNYDWRNEKENEKLKIDLQNFRNNPVNKDLDYLVDPVINTVNSSVDIIANKYDARLSDFSNCYCRSLNKAKSYASLLTDIMNSGTNSQNLSKVIEAHAAPVTSYKLKRYNRRTLDIGAYLGAYIGMETLPQGTSNAQGVYGLTVPIGFNYTWATLRKLNAERVKYPFARKHDKVQEFSGVSHSIGLSIIDIAAPVAYRLTNGDDGALPKDLKWSQMLSPGLHYRYGFRNAPICLSTGVQYTPQLRTLTSGDQLSAVRMYVGILFDMPLFFISK